MKPEPAVTSIEEVARVAGVSAATVSRALSGRGQVSPATRDRVVAAAQELDYVVSSTASSLATGRTMSVGVIVPYLDRWFFSSVLAGVSEALFRHGYDVTLYTVPLDADARRDVFRSAIHRRRVDAMIAVSLELSEDEAQELARMRIPRIVTGGRGPSISTLAIDDFDMSRIATEHLLTLGHRRIAHLGGDPSFDLDFHVPTRRRQGYERALADAGIDADPALYAQADFTIESGYHAAKQLLGRTRFSALFAASDEMAIGTILAARDLGISVPEDLSVIGIDGHPLGAFFGLSTVDQFPQRQGERAVDAIIAELSGTPIEADDLPFELVVRSTSAVPRGDASA